MKKYSKDLIFIIPLKCMNNLTANHIFILKNMIYSMQTSKGTLERSQAIGLYSSHFQIKCKRKKTTSNHFNEPLNKFLARAHCSNLYRGAHAYIC